MRPIWQIERIRSATAQWAYPRHAGKSNKSNSQRQRAKGQQTKATAFVNTVEKLRVQWCWSLLQ